jgi:hypothetical protein
VYAGKASPSCHAGMAPHGDYEMWIWASHSYRLLGCLTLSRENE